MAVTKSKSLGDRKRIVRERERDVAGKATERKRESKFVKHIS